MCKKKLLDTNQISKVEGWKMPLALLLPLKETMSMFLVNYKNHIVYASSFSMHVYNQTFNFDDAWGDYTIYYRNLNTYL